MKETIRVQSGSSLKLDAAAPGDKSLSHRAVIIGSIAQGKSTVRNFLESDDCLRTVTIFRALGVRIEHIGAGGLKIHGRGLRGLKAPVKRLDCGNSGTTMRLMAGLLAAQPFKSVLIGDRSLQQRPMDRVIAPLRAMGARIRGSGKKETAPLRIEPSPGLKGIRFELPVPSAQVKSAVLLAGLYAAGRTVVVERVPTRDHTEVFLKRTGVSLAKKGPAIRIGVRRTPQAFSTEIPGDISSAAFLMALGLIVPGSRVKIRNILWNPTRTGIINVLKRMRADLSVERMRRGGFETTATAAVRPGRLVATRILRGEIPSLIDELPILMVIATQARGRTEIFGAGELRLKETDRIRSMVTGLGRMGARIGARGENIWIEGPTPLKGASVKSFGDHRTAMSLIVAALAAGGVTTVADIANIRTSFPNFLPLLKKAGARFLPSSQG